MCAVLVICAGCMHVRVHMRIVTHEVKKVTDLVHDSYAPQLFVFMPQKENTTFILMTHKYRGSIVVLSINKSVEPNEEQKEMMSGFQQGILCKY